MLLYTRVTLAVVMKTKKRVLWAFDFIQDTSEKNSALFNHHHHHITLVVYN